MPVAISKEFANGSPKDDDRMIRWARECWEAIKPFADRAVYVNALDDALEAGERPVREAYGANYEAPAPAEEKVRSDEPVSPELKHQTQLAGVRG